MSILLDGQLADILSDALIANDLPYPVVIRRTETDSDPFNPSTTIVDYPASGWSDTYAARDVDGTLIRSTDTRAFVLCNSTTITPATTDKYVVGSKAYTIVSVQRDPAGTCWVVQARV